MRAFSRLWLYMDSCIVARLYSMHCRVQLVVSIAFVCRYVCSSVCPSEYLKKTNLHNAYSWDNLHINDSHARRVNAECGQVQRSVVDSGSRNRACAQPRTGWALHQERQTFELWPGVSVVQCRWEAAGEQVAAAVRYTAQPRAGWVLHQERQTSAQFPQRPGERKRLHQRWHDAVRGEGGLRTAREETTEEWGTAEHLLGTAANKKPIGRTVYYRRNNTAVKDAISDAGAVEVEVEVLRGP